jgi:hypothetical protein
MTTVFPPAEIKGEGERTHREEKLRTPVLAIAAIGVGVLATLIWSAALFWGLLKLIGIYSARLRAP